MFEYSLLIIHVNLKHVIICACNYCIFSLENSLFVYSVPTDPNRKVCVHITQVTNGEEKHKRNHFKEVRICTQVLTSKLIYFVTPDTCVSK